MPARTYYTYIIAGRTKVLYIGITTSLERRVQQHKQGTHEGFTKEYRCHHLVWFERYATAASAIAREKQLKGWRRARKLVLIEQENPECQDLSKDWGKASNSINFCQSKPAPASPSHRHPELESELKALSDGPSPTNASFPPQMSS